MSSKLIDPELFGKFVRFVMQHGNADDARSLQGAFRNNSPVLGRRIKLAVTNMPLQTRELISQHFSEDEQYDLFVTPDVADPNHDYTKASRSKRRREELDAKAKELGFTSLSEMLTDWKNNRITIAVNKHH